MPCSPTTTNSASFCQNSLKCIQISINQFEITHPRRIIFWVKALLDHILGKQRQNFWETSVSKKCLFSWICWPLLRTNWIMPPRVQSLRRKTICQNIHVFIIFYCCEPTMIVLLFKIYQENIKIISNVNQFQRMLITLLSSIQTCIFSVEFSSADYESEHWKAPQSKCYHKEIPVSWKTKQERVQKIALLWQTLQWIWSCLLPRSLRMSKSFTSGIRPWWAGTSWSPLALLTPGEWRLTTWGLCNLPLEFQNPKPTGNLPKLLMQNPMHAKTTPKTRSHQTFSS